VLLCGRVYVCLSNGHFDYKPDTSVYSYKYVVQSKGYVFEDPIINFAYEYRR